MMSTSHVSAIDRENSAAHLRIHEKHHLLGSHKKWGEQQTRSTPIQKQFEGSSTSFQKSYRSFGEISNTLDRGSEGNRTEVHKEAPNQPSVFSCTDDNAASSKEPECIQLLPRKKLVNFTQFWKSCQKPDLHTYNPPPSPPPDVTLLPVFQDDKVILEPVPEDLFHLPPPWE